MLLFQNIPSMNATSAVMPVSRFRTIKHKSAEGRGSKAMKTGFEKAVLTRTSSMTCWNLDWLCLGWNVKSGSSMCKMKVTKGCHLHSRSFVDRITESCNLALRPHEALASNCYRQRCCVCEQKNIVTWTNRDLGVWSTFCCHFSGVQARLIAKCRVGLVTVPLHEPSILWYRTDQNSVRTHISM